MLRASERSVKKELRCPCGNAPAVEQPLDGSNPLLRCCRCGLLVRGTLPSEDELNRWYEEDYWDRYRAEQVGAARDNLFAHAAAWLARVRPERGTVVDVGCGGGAFLLACRNAGWTGIGYDPSRSAVAHARSLGLDAHVRRWPPCPLADEQADVVTFINVLDHLRDPFDALREARRVLRPGGLVYIRAPNGPFHAGLLGRRGLSRLRRFAVFHLYGFGRKALLYHLPRLGFAPILVRAAPLSSGEPYEAGTKREAWGRAAIKAALRAGDRALRLSGLARLAWGPSIEALARRRP